MKVNIGELRQAVTGVRSLACFDTLSPYRDLVRLSTSEGALKIVAQGHAKALSHAEGVNVDEKGWDITVSMGQLLSIPLEGEVRLFGDSRHLKLSRAGRRVASIMCLPDKDIEAPVVPPQLEWATLPPAIKEIAGLAGGALEGFHFLERCAVCTDSFAFGRVPFERPGAQQCIGMIGLKEAAGMEIGFGPIEENGAGKIYLVSQDGLTEVEIPTVANRTMFMGKSERAIFTTEPVARFKIKGQALARWFHHATSLFVVEAATLEFDPTGEALRITYHSPHGDVDELIPVQVEIAADISAAYLPKILAPALSAMPSEYTLEFIPLANREDALILRLICDTHMVAIAPFA